LPSPSNQPEGFVRDNLFELVLDRSGARDVRRAGFRRNMVSPMPTQGVIVDREFSRGSLDRCAGCQETLDPHALNVIAALASPGPRALWSCHLFSQSYIFKNEVPLSATSYFQWQFYSTKLWCGQ
jgi:hypothetical protein